MNVRVLQPGDEAALEAFLLPRLASSMFLLANVRAVGLPYTGQRLSGVYVAAFDGAEIVAVMAHGWNAMLIMQAPVGVRELCRAVVEASGRPVGGFIGPKDQVAVAMATLGVVPAEARMDECEKLYRLDLGELVIPYPLRAGEVVGRRAEPGDLDTLAAWRLDYEVEALNAEDTPELRAQCRDGMARGIDEGTLWVLLDGDLRVSMTAFNARTYEAVQVGGVWTPPAFRGRRYARSVVATSLRDARGEGASLGVLFTGERNIPAQRAYVSLGFEHVGDYRLVRL